MNRHKALYGILGIVATIAVTPVYAGLQVSTLYAGGISWAEIIGNIIDTLSKSIFYVSSAAFLLGAMMYVMGFISEENKSKGKGLMISSLIGVAVALSALVILNTVLFFLYGS